MNRHVASAGARAIAEPPARMTALAVASPEDLDLAIGAAIRLRRRHLKLSQDGLAERCGVSFQQIQKYENGANRVSFSRLVLIAHALGLRIGDLVGDIDQASGLSRDDARALDLLAMPGALELLQDFARLPAAVRSKLRELVHTVAVAS